MYLVSCIYLIYLAIGLRKARGGRVLRYGWKSRVKTFAEGILIYDKNPEKILPDLAHMMPD